MISNNEKQAIARWFHDKITDYNQAANEHRFADAEGLMRELEAAANLLANAFDVATRFTKDCVHDAHHGDYTTIADWVLIYYPGKAWPVFP